MKNRNRLLFVILMEAVMILFLALNVKGQSFYSSQYAKNGRTTQLNSKTVAQKKQLNVYQKHSNLYKIRRDIAHSKKRKNFKKGKTR